MKNRMLKRLSEVAFDVALRAAELLDKEVNDVIVTPPPKPAPRPVDEKPPVVQGELMEDGSELPEGFAVISVEEHLVRTEVAKQIEAAFAAIIWMEKGGDEVEVIVTRVYPVHLAESNTYTCMVGTGRKDVMVEEVALPLHQFLQAFAPVNDIKFEEYQA